jgi:DNA-binding HxlR family transcriptional regulator/ubiquinone/menaquinone biosynthesis C-methylase UbiE
MSDINQDNAAKLLDMITGNWRTQVIGVAVELRIFDLLDGGPKTLSHLTQATQCTPDSLYRFMRALVTLELVTSTADIYESTELGQLLSRSAPNSLWAWGEWYAKHLWATWGNLSYSIKTGGSARKMLAGLQGYDHVTRDADAAYVFNTSMTQLSLLVTEAMLEKYKFSEDALIVDVGGGYGEVLHGILENYPQATGILFDLQHAIEGAQNRLPDDNVRARMTFRIGDFFTQVPQGGNYYILKSILHNWADDRAEVLLTSIRRAMPSKSKLICLERLLPDDLTSSLLHQNGIRSDLNMLVGYGGRERTKSEIDKLFAKVGLRVGNILHFSNGYTLVEGN